MSETVRRLMLERVRHLILRRVLGEPDVIQPTPKGGRRAAAQAFLEGRRKEAERINPQTCQIQSWAVEFTDVYGVFEETEGECVKRERFVRNVPDGTWVWDGDLPAHTYKALEESLERQAETYAKYLCPKDSFQLWAAKRDLRSVIRNYAFLLQTDMGTEELQAYLREWQEQHPDQLHRRTGDQTIVLLFDLISTVLDIIPPDNKAAEHTEPRGALDDFGEPGVA